MLSTTNPKIVKFFQENKQFDFDETVLLIISFIEKLNTELFTSVEKTMSVEMLKELFSKVDKMETKFDKIDTKVDKIDQNMTTLSSVLQTIHSILSKEKDFYLNEIKDFFEKFQYSTFDKFSSLLDKHHTHIGNEIKFSLQEIIPKSNRDFYSDISKELENRFKDVLSISSKLYEQSLNSTTTVDKLIKDFKSTIEQMTLNQNDRLLSLLEKFQTYTHNDMKILLNEELTKSYSGKHDDTDSKVKHILSLVERIYEQKNLTTSITDSICKTIDTTYSTLLSSIDKAVHSYITTSNASIIEEINTKYQVFSDIKTFIDKQKFQTINDIGKIGEQKLETVLNECFPTATIENKTSISESGDFMLYRNNDTCPIMFENKAYATNVPEQEVKKFIRDIEQHNCHGIFISQHSGITTKQHFEINIHQNSILVYLHNVNYQAEKIKTAVNIIDVLKLKLDLSSEKDKSISVDTISNIHSELKQFRTQKEQLLKISKEQHKELIKQIEKLEISYIQDYISQFYSDLKSKKSFLCNYCGIKLENNKTMINHYRVCTKKREQDDKKISSMYDEHSETKSDTVDVEHIDDHNVQINTVLDSTNKKRGRKPKHYKTIFLEDNTEV